MTGARRPASGLTPCR